MEKNKLYIYLARLDRNGVEVLSVSPYKDKVYPSRVRDISALGLSPVVQSVVSSRAAENKMTHEVFIESAKSYEDLKKSLVARGYNNVPRHQFAGCTRPTPVNRSMLVTKESIMIRRSNR